MALASYNPDCERNISGNMRLFVTEADNVTSVTVVDGEITAYTLATGTEFHEIQGIIDTLLRTEEGEGNDSHIHHIHRIEIDIAHPSKELNDLRNQLADASPCGIIAIVSDNNENVWMVGYSEDYGFTRPLFLREDNLNSGASVEDLEAQRTKLILETL
jgi:hypothetical protein